MKTSSVPQQNSTRFSWLSRKRVFQIGLILGLSSGIGVSALGGFSYLQLSKDSVSIRDGQLSFSKPTYTVSTVEHDSPHDNGNTSADNGSTITSGNYNTITIVSNRDLPGYSDKGYSVPPPDLSQYTQASSFQLDKLIAGSSDAGRINFGKKDIVILGKEYTSSFDVRYDANSSRFVFQLDGTQKAALIQFGLPDLTSGNASTGAYTVKIYGDDKELWTGECKRSQNSQIVSASVPISDAKLLTIEVSSNGQNDSNLFFTSVQLLKE